MQNYWELMLMYSDEELDIKDSLKIEQTIRESKELKKAYLLNKQLNEFMQGQLIMDQIETDPDLDEIVSSTKSDVATSQNNPENSNSGLVFYINGALLDSKNIENQIDDSEREMYLKGINQETNQWVQLWKEEAKKTGAKDNYTLEIADYIKRGMKTQSPVILNATKKSKRKLVYRISAVAAILILALGIWGLLTPKPTTNDLFAEYYKPYNVIDGQTRGNKHANDQFIEIARLYKNGQYDNVALKLEDWIKKDNYSPKILLIYGITQIEQHKYKNAISFFNTILKNDGEFSVEAKWYLSLCYLKINDIPKAKELLGDLSKTPGIYKPMAEKILKEL